MTRHELREHFPDTYRFFVSYRDSHPFWQALQKVTPEAVQAGTTLLPDLEQVFSSMHLVGGRHVLSSYVREMTTHDELMDFLTKLYVAYIYRNHGATLVRGEHGYDIELELASELLALGVVRLENFDSLVIQFSGAIGEELGHLQSAKSADGVVDVEVTPVTPRRRVASLKGSVTDFLQNLKERASFLGHHPRATHHILAAISHHANMPHELALARHIEEHQADIDEQFPHVAGIVLIDPTPGSERAKFIPFHGHDAGIELLLNRK